ncbi:hypothetical protein P9B03_11895 [Metasolibacillus meyeri]|uniref:Uncharacterized protein n=1 Tax=Metasolibacillus meyeri TaxID=1071052 RepID=A0AAW9NSZ2_9BACL|nr:hypothetical protein [Metasolibacillus meyeri]MEC1179188.1 hypothetical protein [Metasolibacillus meyeri]
MTVSDVLGKPRKYKGLELHPIKISDCEEFYNVVQCLMLPKNATQDINILRMSYLQFLMLISTNEFTFLIDKLIRLLEMILQTDDFRFNLNDQNKFEIIVKNEIVIRERDFDKLKTMISEQNLIDIDDEFINPEIKKQIDDAKEFLSKHGNRTAGIDQQIVAYHCMSGLPYFEIAQLTIYQFQKGLTRFDHILGAEAILNARYSGFVEFKDNTNLPHWLGHIDDSNTDDGVTLDAKEFIDKANKTING